MFFPPALFLQFSKSEPSVVLMLHLSAKHILWYSDDGWSCVSLQVVKLCRECLEKQESVFADTNLYVLRLLSIVSEVLSYLQAFEEAAHYARRMVDGYM